MYASPLYHFNKIPKIPKITNFYFFRYSIFQCFFIPDEGMEQCWDISYMAKVCRPFLNVYAYMCVYMCKTVQKYKKKQNKYKISKTCMYHYMQKIYIIARACPNEKKAYRTRIPENEHCQWGDQPTQEQKVLRSHRGHTVTRLKDDQTEKRKRKRGIRYI